MAPALRFSEAAAMALHTAAFLAQQPERQMTTKELARMLSGSEAHLSKVMQRLVKSGLVASSRGPGGGFLLARPSDSITLLEVWEAIDGPVGNVACMQNPAVCNGSTCVLGILVHDVNVLVRSYLGGMHLSELKYVDGYLALVRAKRPRRNA